MADPEDKPMAGYLAVHDIVYEGFHSIVNQKFPTDVNKQAKI
jgi:hypothetical protein